MSFRPVEAVFFWRYSQDSVYRPVYGRFTGSPYTKDFLQVSGEQQETMERVFRFSGPPVSIRIQWPGDSRDGTIRRASDNRGNFAWTVPGGPLPWRLGDPATEQEITFPGDRSQTTSDGADAQLAALRDLNVEPWIVAVKLHGQDRVAHVRAYMGRPPAGQERRSTATLPAEVQAGMAALRAGTAGGAVTFDSIPSLTRRILEALERDPNVLLVGPPGTGKTVAMEQIRSMFDGTRKIIGFDPEKWEDAWADLTASPGVTSKTLSLVFHPAYSYEDFVAGLVPRTRANGLRLIARPGPLLSLAHWASRPGRRALLLLDEFNRGPAAAIFGDTLALLDKDKRRGPAGNPAGTSIQRPFSGQPMRVTEPFAIGQDREVAAEVSLPTSLWILAALNSTDRSVAPLDAALRRRFAILYVGPDYEALANQLDVAEPQPNTPFAKAAADPGTWDVNDVKELAVRILRVLNERIEFVLGQDFLLGQALFWSVSGDDVETCARSLAAAFDERVASTLRLTFVDQDEALAAILNIPTAPNNVGFHVGRWVEPPPALQAVAPARVELKRLTGLDDWKEAMRSIVGLLV